MPRRRSLGLLLAAVLALVAAPSAAAAERRVADARVGGVAFAGDALVYEDLHDKILDAYAVAGSTRLVLARGNRRRTLLRRSTGVDADDEPTSANLDWAVSRTSLLFRYSYTTFFAAGEETDQEVRGGPLLGPYQRFEECEDASVFELHPVAVSGERGAYRSDCDEGVAVVRSLASPKTPPEPSVPADGNLALAGPYLSVEREEVDRADVVVVDTRDRRELYAARGLMQTEGGIIHALQDDGTLAGHLAAPGDRCTLAWFSTADPAPHPVGDALCDTPVRIADDRIAYWRARAGRRELVVAGLAGGEAVLASAPHFTVSYDAAGLSSLRPTLDFDGARTAYAVARCDGRSKLILRSELAGPARSDRAPLACPVQVTSRSVRASRAARTASLPVRCPRGCSFAIRVGDSTVRQPFARAAGSGRVTLHLDDTTLERLRHAGRSSTIVRLTVFDRAGRETERQLRLTVHR